MCITVYPVSMTATPGRGYDILPHLHDGEEHDELSSKKLTSLASICNGLTCNNLRSSHRGNAQPRKDDQYYCEKDFYVQVQTVSILLPGCFYYPDIGSKEAKHLLKPCSVGTFIIRNSSDPNFLYTISLKTKRGPTSIRISYEHGRFSLDSDESSRSQMPQFSSLMDLIDYYIRLTTRKSSENCRFLDKSGRKDLPILLKTPKLNSVPSLKHLARTTINKCFPVEKGSDIPLAIERLTFLPRPLRSFLKEYPYIH